MTSDSTRPSRRKLLAGIAGVGVAGAGAGAATGAYLNDRARFSSGIQAGEVQVTIECDGNSCTESDGQVTVALEDLEPETRGRERFGVSVDGNPARLWLRTECPPAVDPLGEVLRVRLAIERGDDTTSERLFPSDGEWGSFDELRTEFSDGVRLDESDPCRTDDVELRLAYDLPADATWATTADAEFAIEVYAEQCRHVSETSVETPFAATDCPDLECPDCVELGKLEVGNDRLEPGTYGFDELASAFDGDGHAYEVDVLTLTNKDEDDPETICAAFRLLRDGEESRAPPVCAVDVAGGPDLDSTGPHENSYAIEPPTTRTRGQLCTEWADEDDRDGQLPPAISHLTVAVCPDEPGGDAG